MGNFDSKLLSTCVVVQGQPIDAPPARAGAAAWCRWLWLLMSVAIVVVAFYCSSESPFADDWSLVPVLSGKEALSVKWLLATHNGHRFPLSRLLLWTAWRVFGNGTRVIIMMDALLLVWLARMLMATTARLRQEPGWSDLLGAVLLLNWGHIENVLWSFQTCMFGATALFLIAAAMLARDVRSWRPLHLGIACGSVILLPLHLAAGVAMTPGCAAALAVAALELIRSPDSRVRRRGAIALSAAVVAFLIAAVLGWLGAVEAAGASQPFMEQMSPGQQLGLRLRTMLQCAGMSLGVWGRIPILTGLVVLGFSAFSAAAGWVAWRRCAEKRSLVVRLMLSLLAGWTVAGAVGWGRAHLTGTTERYSLMTVPIIAAGLMLCALVGFPKRGRVAKAVVLLACVFFWFGNLFYGWNYAQRRLHASESLYQDIRERLPMTGIAGRHWFRWEDRESQYREGLSTLKERGFIPFRDIAPDPTYEIRTLLDSGAAAAGDFHGIGLSLEQQPRFDQTLGMPVHVLAVRTRWIIPEGAKWIDYAVEWSLGPNEMASRPLGSTRYGYATRLHEIVQTTWIDATIDRVSVRLCPDSTQPLLALRKAVKLGLSLPRGPFTLVGIELLVPR